MFSILKISLRWKNIFGVCRRVTQVAHFLSSHFSSPIDKKSCSRKCPSDSFSESIFVEKKIKAAFNGHQLSKCIAGGALERSTWNPITILIYPERQGYWGEPSLVCTALRQIEGLFLTIEWPCKPTILKIAGRVTHPGSTRRARILSLSPDYFSLSIQVH